jgi:hypothetical protein
VDSFSPQQKKLKKTTTNPNGAAFLKKRIRNIHWRKDFRSRTIWMFIANLLNVPSEPPLRHAAASVTVSCHRNTKKRLLEQYRNIDPTGFKSMPGNYLVCPGGTKQLAWDPYWLSYLLADGRVSKVHRSHWYQDYENNRLLVWSYICLPTFRRSTLPSYWRYKEIQSLR